MRYFLLSFVIMVVFSSCEEKKEMTMADLKFPDFLEKALSENRIEKSYCLSDNEFYGFTIDGIDTVGYYKYNEDGRISHCKLRFTYSGRETQNEYDENHWVKHVETSCDVIEVYDVSYRFDPDSLVLFQYWSGYQSDTAKFLFDPEGKLIESIECSTPEIGRGHRTKNKFFYEGLDLKRIETERLISKYDIEPRASSNRQTTEYFRSGNRLDSSIKSFYYLDNANTPRYREVSYYNDLGLIEKMIMMDTIHYSYIHQRRNFE